MSRHLVHGTIDAAGESRYPGRTKVPRSTVDLSAVEYYASRKRLPLTRLRGYARGRPFSHWSPELSSVIVTAATRLVGDACAQLLELGESSPEARQRAALRRCVMSFNVMNRELDFIDRGCAADICVAIDYIADHTKLFGETDLAGAWRTW